ncbi:uncharacterized protein B0P05DRAFT_547792 [Gilbertella persicaria]|uniref:uncharacterized protein n=1 Tax=Gilbertella persicaria TaxID=101096 RepID=UPI00221E9AC7|nr:uncharacterized protein B0P05DRAFT_547792 [Gilbertella persicaria]KAI8074228.1 hypothetical protein B0P05DRAFT_547792 [Gilbertella persicaria]
MSLRLIDSESSSFGEKPLEEFFNNTELCVQFFSSNLSAFLKEIEIYTLEAINSIKFVYLTDLINLVNTLRGHTSNYDGHWRNEVVQKLKESQHFASLTRKQNELLQQFFIEQLNINVFEEGKFPNIVLKEKQAITFLICKPHPKARHLTMKDFNSMFIAFPCAKSVCINKLTIDADSFDTICNNTQVEYLHIKLSTAPSKPMKLILHLLKYFEKALKSFKIERTGDDKKKISPTYDSTADKKLIATFNLDLKQLQTIAIDYFYHSIPIIALFKQLNPDHLKSVSVLGLTSPKLMLEYLLAANSLEHLAISTISCPDFFTLPMIKSLKSLSFTWLDVEKRIDVISLLKNFPMLTSLEVGYDGKWGSITKNTDELQEYPHLKHLGLRYVALQENDIDELHNCVPNLKEIVLTSCKIGQSRTETETGLSLSQYELNFLTMKDCSLFFSKKDTNSKDRLISKYVISIYSETKFTAHVSSTQKLTNNSLPMLNNTFTYIPSVHDSSFTDDKSCTVIISVKKLGKLCLDQDEVNVVEIKPLDSDIAQESAPMENDGALFDFSPVFDNYDDTEFLKDEVEEHINEEEIALEEVVFEEQINEKDITAEEAIVEEVALGSKAEKSIESNKEATTKEDGLPEEDISYQEDAAIEKQVVFEEEALLEEVTLEEHEQELEETENIKPAKRKTIDDDSDFDPVEVVSSSNDDSSREEEAVETRRSTRKKARVIVKRQRPKRGKYTEKTSDESDGFEEEDKEDEEAHRKRVSEFMRKVREYKPVIRL